MQKRNFILTLIIGLFLAANISAQDKNDDDVLRIETQLIDVPVVVTDKNGKPLTDLKQSDFVIYEDGKLQKTEEFSATSEPFEVALLLDTSGSARSDLALIQRAAAGFIASLRPGDRVAVIAFHTDRSSGAAVSAPQILADLTDDRKLLQAALDRVQTSNGTPYYDGMLEVADKVFKNAAAEKYRGRRAVVALTDGVDSTSVADFDEVREKFAAAGLVSFFIEVDTREFFEENLLGDCELAMRFSAAQIRRYYRTFGAKSNIEKVSGFCNLGDFERLAVSKKLYEIADAEMRDLAKNSGGNVFAAADLSDARAAFKKVADEIGTKYFLGYYSTNEKRDGAFRKIEVKLKNAPAGSLIRAREGYTAPRD